MNKYLYTLFFFCIGAGVFAQNETLLQRQYYFNDLVINPATAGSKPYNPVSINYRRQWVGIDDAPTFQSFMMHGLLWNQRVGIGGAVYHTNTGPSSQSGLQLAYAYHIPIIKGFSRLSFGVSAFGTQYLLNEKAIKLDQPGDNAVLNGTSKSFLADASAGVYYYPEKYSNKKYFIGLSANNFVQKDIEKLGSNSMVIAKRPKGFFLSAGNEFNLGGTFKFEPSFLVKYYEQATAVSYDLNAKISFHDAIWLGASYRNKESVIAMIGLNGDVIRIGYAYDMGLTSIKKYTSGSHEIYLSLYIKRRELKTM